MDKKILVIDDDPSVRGAFRLILDEAGYAVREAENGLQGIEMAKAERPDLIFLDLKMPGIDGVETLRRLKAMDASLSIYIVTAFSQEYMQELKDAHEAGLKFELASKPLSSSQIRNIAALVVTGQWVALGGEKLSLKLYVVSLNAENRKIVGQLTDALSRSYAPGSWSLETIEVLHMPEKALENEVFATPMLVRHVPVPLLKLLGDLSKTTTVMAAISAQHDSDKVETVIL